MSAAEKQRQQYIATQIKTASKEQLVTMLFDGIIRFCETARAAFTAAPVRIEEGAKAVSRAQAIVMELLYTLDREKGGDVADNLARLHAYACKCLMAAQFRRDCDKLAEVVGIYTELREAWVGAMDALGLSTGVAAPSATAAAPLAAAGLSTTTSSPSSVPVPAGVVPGSSPISAPATPSSAGGYGLNAAAIAAAAARRAAQKSAAPAAPLDVDEADSDAPTRRFTVNPAALAAALAARNAADAPASAPAPAPGLDEIPVELSAADSGDEASAPTAAPVLDMSAAAHAQYARRIAMLAASVKPAAFDEASHAIPVNGMQAQALAAYQRKFA